MTLQEEKKDLITYLVFEQIVCVMQSHQSYVIFGEEYLVLCIVSYIELTKQKSDLPDYLDPIRP